MNIKKYEKDLLSLEKIAENQGNKINLSTVLITVKCSQDEIADIADYFSNKSIDIINEDVEPDNDDNAEIDNKVNPFDPSKIDIKMDKITIDSIVKRIKNDELEFDSSFQRKSGLWSIKQKSQLIESIILRIPLPAFYFDASDDDKWQIIDGLQRIGTLKEFVVDNSFSLTGLEFLLDLNGATFKELPRSLQRRIEETNLNAYLVNPSTPKNVKYNIFKRINTGGLVLEPQEIRNALYQGQAADILLEMSKIPEFIEATCHSIKSDRMLDREFCLRYVSFACLNINGYNGSTDDQLNKGMEYLQSLNANEKHELILTFKNVMQNCKNIFGKFAFRRMNTEERRGPINKALFEAWSIIVKECNEDDIQKLIKERSKVFKLFTRLCYNYEFQNTLRSSDRASVKTRIKKIREIVYEVLNK